MLSLLIHVGILATILVCSTPRATKRQTYPATILQNFADPSVIQGGDGTYYAFATGDYGLNVQVANSSDGVGWNVLHGIDALSPGSIKWAPENPQVWAPDVTPGPDGVYYMYFSALVDDKTHCIGFATSEPYSPLGPYTPNSDDPWVCDSNTGDIDPDQFMDGDGSRWVVYKVDGNSIHSSSTAIMLQQVQDDGYTKINDAIKILDRDNNDGPLIEAPSLIKSDDTYFLTFSSNMWNSKYYDTSFATASSVTGPYTKAHAPDAPTLATGIEGLYGPGGADMWISDVNAVILWHGWDSPDMKERYMYASSFDSSDSIIKLWWD